MANSFAAGTSTRKSNLLWGPQTMGKVLISYAAILLGLTGLFFLASFTSAQQVDGLIDINPRDEGIALGRLF